MWASSLNFSGRLLMRNYSSPSFLLYNLLLDWYTLFLTCYFFPKNIDKIVLKNIHREYPTINWQLPCNVFTLISNCFMPLFWRKKNLIACIITKLVISNKINKRFNSGLCNYINDNKNLYLFQKIDQNDDLSIKWGAVWHSLAPNTMESNPFFIRT